MENIENPNSKKPCDVCGFPEGYRSYIFEITENHHEHLVFCKGCHRSVKEFAKKHNVDIKTILSN